MAKLVRDSDAVGAAGGAVRVEYVSRQVQIMAEADSMAECIPRGFACGESQALLGFLAMSEEEHAARTQQGEGEGGAAVPARR